MNRGQRKQIEKLRKEGFVSEICNLQDLKRNLQVRNNALNAQRTLLWPQRAVIHFGTQLNRKHWIEEAKQGQSVVRVAGDRAFVY